MLNIFERGPIEQAEPYAENFENPEEIELAGGKMEVVDIKPEELKTEVPLLLAPGWGCTTETYKPDLIKLANRKRRVLGVNHPRRGGDLKEIPEELKNEYSQEELRKALNLLGVLEAKGIEKTDVIAHSEGAINTTIAAVLRPDLFRSIVYYAPAGIVGEDQFGRLLKGFAQQGKPAESRKAMEGAPEIPVTEEEVAQGKTAAVEALKYMAENPLRAYKEAREISQSQIHDLLRLLHEKGVKIYIMCGVDDPVFPMEKVQEIIKGDMVDGFLSVRSSHGMAYAGAAESLINIREEAKLEEDEVEVGKTYEEVA